MFGQLCVVDPPDGLGVGDAAIAGDATTKAAMAAPATIKATASRRNGLGADVCGASPPLSAGGGFPCSPCSFTSLLPPVEIDAHSVTSDAQSEL